MPKDDARSSKMSGYLSMVAIAHSISFSMGGAAWISALGLVPL